MSRLLKANKSIMAKVKSTQFEPLVCPVLVHGDNGAEGKLMEYYMSNSLAYDYWKDY